MVCHCNAIICCMFGKVTTVTTTFNLMLCVIYSLFIFGNKCLPISDDFEKTKENNKKS
jgi:hypothetical protein